jgi:SpoIIAA-like
VDPTGKEAEGRYHVSVHVSAPRADAARASGGTMIEAIPDLPDNVVGFTAKGKLGSDDYEKVLMPAVEAALGRHDKIRMLYVLGHEFDGMSAGAIWDDTRVGFSHITRWEKIAVVSDKDWLRHSVDVFGYLMPGEVKAFAESDEQAARAWVVS